MRGPSVLRILKLSLRIVADAFRHFLADDGWAIASHIALSTLMALFPFLIVVTALAGFFFGSKELADEAARILLEAWPKQVAGPIALDVAGVLTDTRGDVLTFGILFALYFASSGVESLRVGLNRAYDAIEPRPWWLLRLESIGYVLVGAVAILAFSFLVVLAPLIWDKLVHYVPTLEPFSGHHFARYAVAAVVLVIALMIVHRWLPAGRRGFAEVAPGIVATHAALADQRRRLRPLSRLLHLRLCVDVCGARLGDDRAGVSLCLRVDLHLRRRIEFGDRARRGTRRATHSG